MSLLSRWGNRVSIFAQEDMERSAPSRVAAASKTASFGALYFIVAIQFVAAVVLFFWAPMDLESGIILLALAFSFNAAMVWNWAPNPGFVRESVEVGCEEDRSLFHWCRTCRLWQPLRAKHCDRCERCVRKYDHHCFWIGGCVGEANHPRFFFLLTVTVAYLVCLWPKFLRCFNFFDAATLDNALLRNVVPFVLLVVCSVMFLLVFLLWVMQVVLIARNQTTWEFASSHRITYLHSRRDNPFDRGVFLNVLFLFRRGPIDWHLVMRRDDADLV
ncbi:hypothetical protein TCDM_08592 [Trypanosoma cruzi Dm28c]|uniref:Palmitoyltransferase n=2 Tax=Trypanosoma cruzi TaxID=5693 RepID=V5B7I7_TRYCR|nr:hypothetical protein TCDM_08592 [Trypanosoma cruzi Dm28c]KAF8281397.1 putative palmitoyl acyltransferase 8 [Trypanosoma cruzi]PBJ74272.1 palmitoyl acyltransferase 8 [Trypanosoma cruzi cruzi]PWU86718.1 putative palmitoyl acyltransferase 8 [Trypanosoma cruzi]